MPLLAGDNIPNIAIPAIKKQLYIHMLGWICWNATNVHIVIDGSDKKKPTTKNQKLTVAFVNYSCKYTIVYYTHI